MREEGRAARVLGIPVEECLVSEEFLEGYAEADVYGGRVIPPGITWAAYRYLCELPKQERWRFLRDATSVGPKQAFYRALLGEQEHPWVIERLLWEALDKVDWETLMRVLRERMKGNYAWHTGIH